MVLKAANTIYNNDS